MASDSAVQKQRQGYVGILSAAVSRYSRLPRRLKSRATKAAAAAMHGKDLDLQDITLRRLGRVGVGQIASSMVSHVIHLVGWVGQGRKSTREGCGSGVVSLGGIKHTALRIIWRLFFLPIFVLPSPAYGPAADALVKSAMPGLSLLRLIALPGGLHRGMTLTLLVFPVEHQTESLTIKNQSTRNTEKSNDSSTN